VHVGEELRRQHHVLAPAWPGCEPIAEDLLGVAVGVEVRGVDEVPAQVEIRLEDALGLLDRRPGATRVVAERHRAERERADPQSGPTEGDVVIE
jgi:hypothetical protein